MYIYLYIFFFFFGWKVGCVFLNISDATHVNIITVDMVFAFQWVDHELPRDRCCRPGEFLRVPQCLVAQQETRAVAQANLNDTAKHFLFVH